MPKLPGINHLRAVRALEEAGFKIVNQGKHIVMSDGTRILTIPPMPMTDSTSDIAAWDRNAERYASTTWTASDRVYAQLREILWESIGEISDDAGGRI